MVYVGLVVTSLFATYAITQMSFAGVPHAIASIKIQWIIPVVLGKLSTYFLSALRIRKILGPIKNVSLWSLFAANSIGFMAVFLLPARTGEIVRAYVISKKENISVSATMAAIVVEKIFDVVSVVCLLFFVFLVASPTKIMPGTWQNLKGVGIALIIFALGTALILYLFSSKNDFVKNALVRSIARFSSNASTKFENCLESFDSGLSIIRDARQMAIISGCSFLLWMAIITYYYFILRMLGTHVSFEIASVVTLMIIFSAAIPASPGLIGTFHAAIVFALVAYGMTQEYALGIAVMHHLIVFSFSVGLGLYFLWQGKMTFSDMRNIKAP